MELPIYNKEGSKTGMVAVPEGVFGLRWNAALVHQVVTSQLSNRRMGTANAKTRGEVRGGGKKPWRQKGTGRARHGSIRSPIWKGGGVSHGPRAERDFTKKINKKMARKALLTVLSAKARDNEIIVLDELLFPEAKTKHGAVLFTKLAKGGEFKNLTRKNGVLIALPKREDETVRTLGNLPYTALGEVRNLNASEVLRFKYILFPKQSIAYFSK